jgi:hypothetical protein
MNPHKNSKRRAIIAEYAFSLFVTGSPQVLNQDNLAETDIVAVKREAWRATESRLAAFVGQGVELVPTFSRDENEEIDNLTIRLHRFFQHTTPPLVLRPIFKGCGYLDSSEADVIAHDTLYEIKTVDRQVRSADIRQIITYAALNFASHQYDLSKIGLFNPLGGYYFHFDVEFVCAEIAGTSAQELFMTIIDAVSSAAMSR